ncbi:MAG: hypothetical protein AABY13_04470, partial [Nanoarchaeota archaeon]
AEEKRKVYKDMSVMGALGAVVYGGFMLSEQYRVNATTGLLMGVAGLSLFYAKYVWDASKDHDANVALLEDVTRRIQCAGITGEGRTDIDAWHAAIKESIDPLYLLFRQADKNQSPLKGNEKYLIMPGGEARGL